MTYSKSEQTRRGQNERARKYRAKLAERIRQEAMEREKPSAPYIERTGEALTVTANGIAMIEYLARARAQPGMIASQLGIPMKALRLIFDRNKGDNPEHLAFERGHYVFQQELIDRLWAHSEKNFIPAIFLAKSLHGMRENAEPAIVNNNQPIIFLPSGMTEDQYYAKAGVSGPIDTRDPQRRQIVRGSESSEHPFGKYTDGTPVPDYGGIRMLPAPSNPSSSAQEE